MKRILLLMIIAGLTACSGSRNGNSDSGRQQRLRVEVGEIKEVKVAGKQTGDVELIGTSENNEVVEVSRQGLTPPVDTLQKRSDNPTVFLIKGVTNGTAKVTFSEKKIGDTGSGRLVRTYVVQVSSK